MLSASRKFNMDPEKVSERNRTFDLIVYSRCILCIAFGFFFVIKYFVNPKHQIAIVRYILQVLMFGNGFLPYPMTYYVKMSY